MTRKRWTPVPFMRIGARPSEDDEMSMIITLFGRLGEAVAREVELGDELAGATVDELREALAAAYPKARSDLLSPRVRACVNDVMVPGSHVVSRHDRVGLLPPVSGG